MGNAVIGYTDDGNGVVSRYEVEAGGEKGKCIKDKDQVNTTPS